MVPSGPVTWGWEEPNQSHLNEQLQGSRDAVGAGPAEGASVAQNMGLKGRRSEPGQGRSGNRKQGRFSPEGGLQECLQAAAHPEGRGSVGVASCSWPGHRFQPLLHEKLEGF